MKRRLVYTTIHTIYNSFLRSWSGSMLGGISQFEKEEKSFYRYCVIIAISLLILSALIGGGISAGIYFS